MIAIGKVMCDVFALSQHTASVTKINKINYYYLVLHHVTIQQKWWTRRVHACTRFRPPLRANKLLRKTIQRAPYS
jgi:hypothetical protein